MREKVIKTIALLYEACYPNEKTNDEIKKLLEGLIDKVIVDGKEPEEKYQAYSKTIILNHDIEEDDIRLLDIFNQILQVMESNFCTAVEKDSYITTFIDELTNLFPNLKNNSQIKETIICNLKIIDIDPLKYSYYSWKEKILVLRQEQWNYETFHEFIHVLRGKHNSKNKGLEEGMVELITYMYRDKTTIDKITIRDDEPYKDLVKIAKKIWESLKEEDIVERFLLGDDLFPILEKYFGKEDTEYIVERMNELLQKIESSNIYGITSNINYDETLQEIEKKINHFH